MFRIISCVFAGLGILIGCEEKRGPNNLLPELSTCDSAAIMYYHTPGNPRFFKMTKLADQSSLASIAADINGNAIAGNDTCASQGKIYYYGKADEVYVAYFTRAKQCGTLSFIKTGQKYFVQMSDEVKKLLDELEPKAVEPKPAIK